MKFDRRADVGSKLFIGIMTAVLTAIFLGSLGFGIRASEINGMQEIRLVKIDSFIETQHRLNEKLESWIDEMRVRR